MPKIVDHDQRRAELVRVVWKVIARDGIEGATVRRVAQEAGVSTGGLRHYFDSQHGLLEFAAEAVAASVATRLLSHTDPQLMLEEFLPLDEQRQVEVDVWLACLMRARVDSSLAELRRASWAGERHVCRLAVAYCRGASSPARIGDELPADLEQRALRLHVFIDGLTLQAAAFPDQLSTQDIRSALRTELDLIREGDR
ncbi:MAG: TetR/AcrR family transcriptional regulator [Kibdelosporangium sp.]